MALCIFCSFLPPAWDGDEKVWVRPSLPSLRMMAGPNQHLFSSIFDAWRLKALGVFNLLI